MVRSNPLKNVRQFWLPIQARAAALSRRFTPRVRQMALPMALLLPVLASAFLSNLGDLSNYHGDENIWIAAGSLNFHLYMQGNYTDPFWRNDLYAFGSYNPQVGKHLIGLGTYLGGHGFVPFMPFKWDHSLEWNIEQGNVLPPDTVWAGRAPVALLGVVSCLLLYWLATRVAGHWCGYVAVCNLVGAQLLLICSRRAMVDTPALCFGLLALIGTLYLQEAVRSGSHHRALNLAVCVGVACGLAASSKLNALLILGICGLAVLFEWLRCVMSRRGSLGAFLCGIVVLTYAWLIFFASNPFLFPAPIEGVAHMLDLARVVRDSPSFLKTVTLPEKIEAVWHNTLFYAPLSQLGLPGDRWLLLCGCLALAWAAWRNPADFWRRGLGLVCLWICVSYIGVTLMLSNDWERYYLPLQPCAAFVEAYGALWLFAWARRAFSFLGSGQPLESHTIRGEGL